MSHTWVNGLHGQWFNGYVPSATDWETLDLYDTYAVNGDGGSNGTPYTPAANVVVSGAGLWIAGPSYLKTGVQFETSTAHGLVLGDSDYPLLVNSHPGSTRVLHSSPGRGLSAIGWFSGGVGSNGVLPYYLRDAGTAAGIGPGVGQTAGHLLVPLRVHQGGTITQATVTVGPTSHSGLPAVFPAVRLIQVDALGNVTVLTAAGTGDANGFVQVHPTPILSAWNGSTAVTWTWTAVAGVVVDRTRFAYYAELVDEYGTNSAEGNVFYDVAVTLADIPDMRPS